MSASSPTDEASEYKPKDAIEQTINTTLVVGGAGLFTAAVQNSLARENLGIMGVFTKFGGTTTSFAASGAFYAMGATMTANLREKDDYVNEMVGGFLGGAAMGLRFRSFPAVIGVGSLYSAVLGLYQITGGSLMGPKKDPDRDEFAEKMKLRANRRRPIQETIDELGEGRGIQAPGYQERRRERIKQNYGIDIPTSFPPPRPTKEI